MEGNKISAPELSRRGWKAIEVERKRKREREKSRHWPASHPRKLPGPKQWLLRFQGRRLYQKVVENNSKLCFRPPPQVEHVSSGYWGNKPECFSDRLVVVLVLVNFDFDLSLILLTWDWVLGLGNSWGLEGWGVRRPYFFIFLMFGLKQGCIPRTSLWKCPKSLCGGVGWCLNIIFGQGFSFGLVFVSGQAFQLAQAALHAPPEVALQCVAGH